MRRPLQRWVALVDHSCGPQVLSFLDSSGFRAVLRDCCPQIQALPAEELLRRYRNEARVAELAHAAPLKEIMTSEVTVMSCNYVFCRYIMYVYKKHKESLNRALVGFRGTAKEGEEEVAFLRRHSERGG